ncbi:MAG: hypothetical protein ABF876_14650 [Acetobacter aceti]|jgi:hypothetical protein|uniref:hypothetical protein n=1 Tax=Novacetimonas labruscae TaxID=3229898 RepID=UPI000AADB16D
MGTPETAQSVASKFLIRSPYTATAEVVRQFQIAQNETGRPTSTIDPTLSALSFFITRTLT